MNDNEKQFLKNLGFSYHAEEGIFSKLYSGMGTFWIDGAKRLGSIDFPFIDLKIRGDMLRRQELDIKKFMKEYSKDLKSIRKEKILVEKEAAGALMMDMMGLSDNPLIHYLPEESLGDADMVNSVSKAFVNALDEERTELRSFAPKEGTIGPIRGEQFPIDKEQE